jgi:two-component system sensor histidine kinase MprB
MTLRTRFALSAAALVAIAIGVTGVLLHQATEEELYSEVDAFLEARVGQLDPRNLLGPPGRPPRGSDFEDRSGRGRQFGLDRFSLDDAATQLVTSTGLVIPLTSQVLPVTDEDLAVISSERSRIRTTSVEGVDYRVITAGLGGDRAVVMVGRDLTEVNGALGDLRRRTAVVGGVGAALAALIAWAIASRLSRPLHHLTQTAEHVARTQDLTSPIDVTSTDEVGRLASSFNTMLRALDTSRRQQQRLVMDASHELRTPLTSIRTNIDLLRRAESISADDQSEVLNDVSREIDALSTLVVELVELSTSSQRPEEPVADVDLGSIAVDAASVAERRHGREVEVDVSGDAIVLGHHMLLMRAVSNLIDNAIKFSSPDTRVLVTVNDRRVAVRDFGPGIAPADRALVFDRFYRSIETSEAPGSGLGLAIVADIVAAHNGMTFVEDPTEGPGAVVGFTVAGI